MKIVTTFLLSAISCLPLAAQEFQPPPTGELIKAVSFEPEPPTQSLLDLLELRVGDQFMPDALRNSIKNIMRLGVYADVRVTWTEVDDGIALKYQLEEIPAIEGITISGTGPISKQRIISATQLSSETRYDQTRERRIVSELRRLYRNAGYFEANFQIYSMVNIGTGGVRLEIRIDPGEPTLLRNVNITGFPALGKEEILAQLRRSGIGKIFQESEFRSELGRIQEFYFERKFLTADVRIEEINYVEQDNVVDVDLIINAGPQLETVFDPPHPDADFWLRQIPFGDRNVPLVDILNNGRTRIENELRRVGNIKAEVQIDFPQETEGEIYPVNISIDKGDVYKVGRLILEGLDEDLRQAVLPLLNLSRKGWFSLPRYSEAALREDMQRSLQILRDLGYRSTRVELQNLELDDMKNIARVVLRFDPGPRSTIASIAFIGNQSFEVQELLPLLDLRIGDPLTIAAVEQALQSLRYWYDSLGFTDAQIAARTRGEGPHVELVFDISERQRSTVRKVIVAGNNLTREDVVRRALTFHEGDPYSLQDIAESQRALYRLGIFNRVRILEVEEELSQQDKRLVVRVDEMRPYSLLYGFGVDSEEKLRFSFGFSNNNIFGQNIEAALNTRISQIQRRYQATLRAPRILHGLIDNLMRIFYEEVNRPGYGVRRKGFMFESTGFYWRDWQIIGRLQYKWNDLFDVKLNPESDDPVNRYDQDVRLSILSTVWIRDTRDDLIDPTEGSLTNLNLQFSPEFLGSDIGYIKTEAQYYTYREIYPAVILATGIRLGLAEPFDGDSRIPISERFFLGGSNSVRGFPLDFVGPKYVAPNGEEYPTGGNAMINGNIELRFPLLAGLNGVTFYDFGNIYTFVEDFSLSDMEHSIGLGFRLGTPLGPLRFDFGVSLRDGSSEPHFAFGHAF